MKILVVEDEYALRTALVTGLKKKGFEADGACDGQEAIDMYFEFAYDLVILDLNLPKLDGLEVLKEIRLDNELAKVIILSARSEIDDKVVGFDLGANDYLAKPFHFKELDARVRALLRRDFVTVECKLEINDLVIDTAKKQVFKDDNLIDLTKKEYGILEYLVINKKRVVSSEELIEHVWGSDVDPFISSIKVHLNSLRKKIGEDIIMNKRGVGYYVE